MRFSTYVYVIYIDSYLTLAYAYVALLFHIGFVQ